MATRSTIGIKQDNGTIKLIYCHFDGYFEGVGHKLLDHYQDKEKINKLMELGGLSSLEKEIDPDPTKPHDWKNPQENVTVAYMRDRGDEDFGPYTLKKSDNHTMYDEEFNYLFKGDKWYYRREGRNSWQELKKGLKSW